MENQCDFKESLKSALCNNNVDFLEENKDKYSINHRFLDECNDTLLLYSLSDAESDVYKYILGRGADITLLNNEGENVIHSCVYSGIQDRLSLFVNNENLNHRSKDGVTPLLLSILLKKENIALSLIKKGANVNISDNEGYSPLHAACFIGSEIVVSELISRGANLNLKTAKGNRPLALAVNEGHENIVKLLFRVIYGNSGYENVRDSTPPREGL